MIRIHNLTTVLAEEDFLKKVAKTVLEGESASWQKEKTELSIVLVAPDKIKELNKKYRRKNRATDVLSFSYRARRSRAKVKEEDKVFFAHDNSGEVVICLREVKKNAKMFKSTYERELTRVLIHGILHLFGYDHGLAAEEKKMKKKETGYLSQNLWLRPILSPVSISGPQV